MVVSSSACHQRNVKRTQPSRLPWTSTCKVDGSRQRSFRSSNGCRSESCTNYIPVMVLAIASSQLLFLNFILDSVPLPFNPCRVKSSAREAPTTHRGCKIIFNFAEWKIDTKLTEDGRWFSIVAPALIDQTARPFIRTTPFINIGVVEGYEIKRKISEKLIKRSVDIAF